MRRLSGAAPSATPILRNSCFLRVVRGSPALVKAFFNARQSIAVRAGSLVKRGEHFDALFEGADKSGGEAGESAPTEKYGDPSDTQARDELIDVEVGHWSFSLEGGRAVLGGGLDSRLLESLDPLLFRFLLAEPV
jgi:hypothetical protein